MTYLLYLFRSWVLTLILGAVSGYVLRSFIDGSQRLHDISGYLLLYIIVGAFLLRPKKGKPDKPPTYHQRKIENLKIFAEKKQ